MKNTATKPSSRKKSFKKIPWRTLRPWIIIIGVMAAVLGSVAIYTAITDQSNRTVYRFDYDKQNGTYYDKKQDITYVPVPFCFEAVLNGAEDSPYAKSDFQSLYQVGYRDSEGKVHLKKGTDWLTTSKSSGGQVYYNPDAVQVPEFADFDWDVIYFTNPDSGNFSTYTLNAEDTDKLMKTFVAEDAENLFETHYKLEELDVKLTLKVKSKTFQWLYLNLNLLADTEDNYYLCPQGVVMSEEPLMVAVDKSYFQDYFKTLEEIVGETEKTDE